MQAFPGLTLSRITDIAVRINSAQDLHSLLTVIMDTARELLNCEASSLLLYDPENDNLIFDIARGSRGKLLAEKRLNMGQGIAGLCAQQRKTIIVNDASKDDRVFRQIDKDIGFVTRNVLAVPMLTREKIIGVLEVVNTSDERDYSGQDVRLLNYLSNTAAVAIQNRQLYEEIKDRADELQCLYEVSQHLTLESDLDIMLDKILEAIGGVLGAERLSIIFHDNEKYGERRFRLRGFSLEEGDVRIDPERGVAGMVLRSGDPLLVRDVGKELDLKDSHDERYKTTSFISVPILLNERVVGVLNAADKRDGERFDVFELRVLSTIAGQVADLYRRFQSRRREMELQTYRKDLETAALIQMNSLPQIPSQISGMEIATRYIASRDVGGDFYDLIFHSDERISLVMADVAGKGVPAALFMEYSKTLLASRVARSLDPVSSLFKVNNEICSRQSMHMFVTVMLVQVERELYRLRLASAGHNHQILYRKNFKTLESLSAKGPPLGVLADSEYLERVIDYSPGDVLILYTDGITEANNHSFEEFGEDRLFNLVKKYGERSPEDLIEIIFSEMKRFGEGAELPDDATMMVVRL